MQKRKNIPELFTTFITFINAHGSLSIRWKSEPKLVQNLQRLLASESEASEKYLSLLFLKAALKNKGEELASLHLSAYLEETCYWMAVKTANKVYTSDYTWQDYFQIARALGAEPQRIFAKYDSRFSSIKTYAQLKLETGILEVIHQGREKQKYSDAGLLRSLTKTYLKKALARRGFNPRQQDRYVVAWQAFKQVYHPRKEAGTQRLAWPSKKGLSAIAQRYHQLADSPQTSVTGEEIKSLLDTCVEAVKYYAAPKQDSLDDPDIHSLVEYRDSHPHTQADYQASQPSPEDELWETESRAEEREQFEAIFSHLSQAFDALSPESQKMLELAWGLRLTQADIGKVFQLEQYQVSRQLDREKQSLLKSLAEWSQANFGLHLTPEQIGAMSDSLEGWLEWHCQSSYHQLFKRILLQESLKDDFQFLKESSAGNWNAKTIAANLGMTEKSVARRRERIEEYYLSQLQENVTASLSLETNSLKSAAKSFPKLITNWLLNAPYASLESQFTNDES